MSVVFDLPAARRSEPLPTGFVPFFRKELAEVLHTWRLWVLPGFLVFSALSSPIVMYVMPSLVDRLGASGSTFTIEVKNATPVDVYIDYVGNLQQLVLFALIIAYGGLISGELRSGTGILALTKPLSRTAYVVTKWLAQASLVIAAALLAALVCLVATSVLFATGPAGALLGATLLWIAYAGFMLAVMLALSSALSSPIAASGAGIGVYASLVLLAAFNVTERYTPAGIPAAMQELIKGENVVWIWPTLTALVGTAILIALSVWLFRRREL